jgi:hypothetical protein
VHIEIILLTSVSELDKLPHKNSQQDALKAQNGPHKTVLSSKTLKLAKRDRIKEIPKHQQFL